MPPLNSSIASIYQFACSKHLSSTSKLSIHIISSNILLLLTYLLGNPHIPSSCGTSNNKNQTPPKKSRSNINQFYHTTKTTYALHWRVKIAKPSHCSIPVRTQLSQNLPFHQYSILIPLTWLLSVYASSLCPILLPNTCFSRIPKSLSRKLKIDSTQTWMLSSTTFIISSTICRYQTSKLYLCGLRPTAASSDMTLLTRLRGPQELDLLLPLLELGDLTHYARCLITESWRTKWHLSTDKVRNIKDHVMDGSKP